MSGKQSSPASRAGHVTELTIHFDTGSANVFPQLYPLDWQLCAQLCSMGVFMVVAATMTMMTCLARRRKQEEHGVLTKAKTERHGLVACALALSPTQR